MSHFAGNRNARPHTAALFIARWFSVVVALLLTACSQQNAATPTSPTSVAAVPTTASAPTTAPTTAPVAAAPTVQATAQPAAVAETAPKGKVLYACKDGLCSSALDGTDARTIVPFVDSTIALDGYAFSADGSKIVYALRSLSGPTKELKVANIYMANADGSESKPLFSIQGSGGGDSPVTGLGVVGLSADNSKVIFAERSQVFISALDGADRKQITKSIGGEDGTPIVSLSPQGTSLLVVEPKTANNVTLYNVADGSHHSYDLDFSMRAETFSSDDSHIVAVRYDPPFDPQAATATAAERKVLGYAEVNTQSGISRAIGDAQPGTAADVVSNAIGGYVLLADKTNNLSLLNLAGGQHAPVTLPNYRSGSQAVLFISTVS